MKRLWLAIVVLCALIAPTVLYAQSPITITDGGVMLTFPDRIVFTAQVQSVAAIKQIVLEYGTEQLTCGTVVAKAFPTFTPGTTVAATWTWEMRQSGSEPPGATIWYRWRAADEAGNTLLTETKRVTWIDSLHAWQSVSAGQVTLHWYDGDTAFANELLATATGALDHLGTTTGVKTESPIQLYIYANTDDMRAAVLYEPGWTGGLAFSENGITIIGISPDILDWGKDTIAHELTHLVVGRIAFSCIGNIPTWLNEGIAVYGEGGLDATSAAALQAAITANTLIAVRSLSGGFSELADKADLSYSESYSLVNYLISTYGSDKLLALFRTLSDGTQPEPALEQAYGFGLDGLEDQWRASVQAAPRAGDQAVPSPTPQPSPVPTYQPIAAAPAGPTRIPTAVGGAIVPPTAAPAAPTAPAAPAGGDAPATAAPPPSTLNTRLIILGVALLLGILVVGLAVLRLVARR